MALDQHKTVSLDLEPYVHNEGILRTDLAPNVGTARGSGFSVDFSVLYEVHGNFDPPDKNNSSLLVIRMDPFPKNHEKQFLRLTAKLSVSKIRGAGQDYGSGGDEESIPVVKAFEPASQGGQVFDVHTTNEVRESMAQLNLQVPISQTASLGGQLSNTGRSEYKMNHLLKVTARQDNDDGLLPRSTCNRVTWKISAANKDQGIGDMFTVALLVKRPPGSQFQLLAEVDGDVGSFSQAAKNFFSLERGCRRRPTVLGKFPTDDVSDRRLPQGVIAEDLHRASTDNVMRRIPEIGLHLPEQARRTRSYPVVDETTSFESNSAGPLGANDSGASAGKGVQERITDAHQVGVAPPRAPPIGKPGGLADNGQAPVLTTHPHSQETPAIPAPLAGVNDSLAAITRQLQVMTGVVQRESARIQARGSTTRIRRYRELAVLHERMAELHREEAEEDEALHRGEAVFTGDSGNQSQND